jgi:hypothetical protein
MALGRCRTLAKTLGRFSVDRLRDETSAATSCIAALTMRLMPE